MSVLLSIRMELYKSAHWAHCMYTENHYYFLIEFCVYSLFVSPQYCVYPSSPLNLRFYVRFSIASAHYSFYMVWEREGWEHVQPTLAWKENLPLKNKKNRMDKGIASSLLTEELDRNNYASWLYKMHQYLLGHGYWSYVNGANDTAPDSTHRDLQAWEQSASRVLYVEYKCIMDVFTLYPWTAHVQAIYVNSINGSCPKWVTI